MSQALGAQRQGERPGPPGGGRSWREPRARAGRSSGPRHGRAEVWPPGSREADQPLQAASAFEGLRDPYGGIPFFKNFLMESLKPAQGLDAKRTRVKGWHEEPPDSC